MDYLPPSELSVNETFANNSANVEWYYSGPPLMYVYGPASETIITLDVDKFLAVADDLRKVNDEKLAAAKLERLAAAKLERLAALREDLDAAQDKVNGLRQDVTDLQAAADEALERYRSLDDDLWNAKGSLGSAEDALFAARVALEDAEDEDDPSPVVSTAPYKPDGYDPDCPCSDCTAYAAYEREQDRW